MRSCLIGILMATAFLTMGCDDDQACTLIARRSVEVSVIGLEGRGIDSVTFENNGTEDSCAPPFSNEDGGDATSFTCGHERAGLFTISVTIGAQTWTESVTVAEDECHVITEFVTVDVSAAP